MSNHEIVLYHSPQTRGTGVMYLLEELGVPYELKVLDRSKGENRSPEFLALNPLGKFPTIVHNDTVITEQVACYIYLADLFLEKGWAPGLNDLKRGAYLRWMAYQGSSFEPAMIDRAFEREPIDPVQLPYGVSVHSKAFCRPGEFDPTVTLYFPTRGYAYEKASHPRTMASPYRPAA
ncbi:glutathione S-transferase family protein [Nitrincola sp. MINF-07-Sa-05]|uniref:glutathione S-transferase family protein n=1 Tax=Nitrincola salilacus TaxID=3400273 RepID=UPI00391823D4